MRFKTVGNKYDAAYIVVRNVSASLNQPQGSPVYFVMNGTRDGLDVQDANAAAGAGQEFLAGIVATPGGIGINQYGEAQVFGLCQSTRIVTATRPASTDSYNSFTAIVVGDILIANTLSDATSLSQNVDALSRSAAGSASAIPHAMIAAQAYTSTASQSSSFDTTSRTAITTTLKTFLRLM